MVVSFSYKTAMSKLKFSFIVCLVLVTAYIGFSIGKIIFLKIKFSHENVILQITERIN